MDQQQSTLQYTNGQDPGKLKYLLKWLLVCIGIGLVAGIAAAIFLASLDLVTNFRENHIAIIFFLPLAGLLIGIMYHRWGNTVSKGNQLLLEEIHSPKKTLPFMMAPFIYLSTIITHLFGGSAGREGTAVQMGGSIADQFAKYAGFNANDRKLILIAGIAAGFAAVFGTPLAGIVFGWEVVNSGHKKNKAILPSIITAFVADITCKQCGIQHTHYAIPLVPEITAQGILFSVLAGICFGCVARLFIGLSHTTSAVFQRMISYAPLRPLIGGIMILVITWCLQTTKYLGLGIPVILGAFDQQLPASDFIFKMVLTVLTLSSGFKGGEVTPLFFIGAALGSTLSFFMPLPVGLLAGMGFISVFAAAANTPLACILMSMELFGTTPGAYMAIACLFAAVASGPKSIYGLHAK